MRGNLILCCVMSGLLGLVSCSERELSLLIYGAEGGFLGLGWKEGSRSCGSKKRLSAPLPSQLLAALSDKSLKFPCSSTAFLSFDK